jgi:hypothetical protein
LLKDPLLANFTANEVIEVAEETEAVATNVVCVNESMNEVGDELWVVGLCKRTRY